MVSPRPEKWGGGRVPPSSTDRRPWQWTAIVSCHSCVFEFEITTKAVALLLLLVSSMSQTGVWLLSHSSSDIPVQRLTQ